MLYRPTMPSVISIAALTVAARAGAGFKTVPHPGRSEERKEREG